ncbi:MAG: L-seryl-tRNA(Sec) selenium transferase [Deltaproteobacteria bacterium CG07_land_8_20_14_0_80_60_11]|nr:MAG: L-seryl-tRNA(Sec) selenium transferase [Deltaproteobacteria bacterium CG07_land_8_20_14_0_80_60_11]
MDAKRASLLRQLPQVDDLLRHPELAPAVSPLPRLLAAAVVRRVLAAARQTINAEPPAALPPRLDETALLQDLREALLAAAQPRLRRVVNATGVVIHTNLGRAPLGEACLAQLLEVASRYNTLEYDLARGARGSRQDHLEAVLQQLTGAEGVLVVNNNAAAVLLALNTLAAGREVVISRGQLVEIGGSFRLPEIMAASGAILREVGTTNKTYLRDFEKAITSETAVLLKVHPSNFRIMGFTHEVTLTEMVDLGRRYGLKVVEDLGSGCLVDLSRYGLEREPTVQETIKAGADLVLFSGDKLLGGPQAGLILGNRAVVEALRKNPLTRALRPDKMTLTALEATLRLFLDEPRALAEIPTLRMLTRPVAELNRQARALARRLRRRFGERLRVEVVKSEGRAGGGALPQAPLPSRALALTVAPLTPQALEARLRQAGTPVIGRVEHGVVLLDLRTMLPGDREALMAALEEVLADVQ